MTRPGGRGDRRGADPARGRGTQDRPRFGNSQERLAFRLESDVAGFIARCSCSDAAGEQDRECDVELANNEAATRLEEAL